MKYYRLTAKLLAPLVIQQSRQSSDSSALPYLPGSTLRGTLAARYLNSGGSPEDEEFRSLFLDNPVCFPNFFPSDENGTAIAQFLPLTAFSCKRNPGFKDKHGVRDMLAAKAAVRIDPKLKNINSCLKCGQAMKAFTGSWNGDCQNPCKFSPSMIYQRHTGIDRDTGTIAPSIFFMTQAIADFQKDFQKKDYYQQHLSGGIFITDKQHEILSSLMVDPLFAGGDRTRGFGEIALSFSETDLPFPAFNIMDWDKKFRKKLNSLVEKESDSGTYFSIKLESHAIFVDSFLRPSYDMELSFPDINPVLKIAKSEIVRGWQSSWGLPKPDDMGLAMGSVYLFRYTGNDLAGLESYLQKIIKNGIGLRREEGFGRISVCEPIHLIEVI
jgi:CRISPR-associated protein Csx10